MYNFIFCRFEGTSTIANGTVRVLTTPAVSNIPINIANKVNVKTNYLFDLRISIFEMFINTKLIVMIFHFIPASCATTRYSNLCNK